MKVEIKKLLNILKDDFKIDIDSDVKNEIIKKVENTFNTKNIVLWKTTVYYDRRDEKDLQGTISKENYEKIKIAKKKALKKDPDMSICFGEISKHCYMYCDLKDIKFSTNKQDIIDFYDSGKNNDELIDYLYDLLYEDE